MNEIILNSFRTESKYMKIYLSIIDNALLSGRLKISKNDKKYEYFEAHHILPKSLFKGFSNLKIHTWNKVLLTPKEHFICHLLIWKHYKSLKFKNEEIKMGKAIFALQNGPLNYTSNIYASLKLNLSHSNETKLKISNIHAGKIGVVDSEGNRFKVLKTDERLLTGELISYNIGYKMSPETKRKISASNTGKVVSETTRLLLSNRKGVISPNYSPITIFDSNNNPIVTSLYNHPETLISLGLPRQLRYTLKGGFLYETNNLKTINFLTNNGNIKFKGWYARYSDVTQTQRN